VIAALLTIAATAFVGAAFLSAGARRFDAADLVGYFRLRAWCSLLVIAAPAVVGLAVTHDDARYVHDGLTSGSGLVLVLAAVACAVLTAGLLYRGETGARFTAVGRVALVVVAWGLARRPCLIPTSLTVSQAVDTSAT
jgi:cytochrome d ubiquinol oxidase subunit II